MIIVADSLVVMHPVVSGPESGSTFPRGSLRFLAIKTFLLVLQHSYAARNQHTHTLHIRYFTTLERRCSSSATFGSEILARTGPRVYRRNIGLREVYRLYKPNLYVLFLVYEYVERNKTVWMYYRYGDSVATTGKAVACLVSQPQLNTQ